MRMREDWDRRARENAFHYVASGRENWTEEEFRASGEQSVRELILDDGARLCPDGNWQQKTLLEIGCGAGRMTGSLAQAIGQVHAVDVSPEMLAIAKRRHEGVSNIHFHLIDGQRLDPLGEQPFDIVFSAIVFQHIPEIAAIESLVADAARRTNPGGVLKLQVQGDRPVGEPDRDTWLGATVSALDVLRWRTDCGVELLDCDGVGTQEMWLWMRPESGGDSAAAERKLLLQSEAAWERIHQRQAAALNERTRWASKLDADAARLRAHLQAIYSSPAYRAGRRLGIAPDPINESEL
jgi:2-polyprenyl-3-methyl-5-hydroxy-6-metoxy-1,4-benzoquinol methylase